MTHDSFTERDDSPGEPLRLPPWEERDRYGLLNALYLTAKDVLLSPGHFFQRMPTRLGLVQPLLFGVIITFAASWKGANLCLGWFLLAVSCQWCLCLQFLG